MRTTYWLTILSFIFLSFSGFYPTFDYPPIKKATVFAQGLEQKTEIISSSFSKPLTLPHLGYLSTRFSSFHPGIDIAAGLGLLIHPITNGEVIETGTDFWGLGNYVTISHENGFKSKYAHLGRIYVKVGTKVNPENTIGEVGLTGHTSGPHTHLEISYNGGNIDPQKLLPEIPRLPIWATPQVDGF